MSEELENLKELMAFLLFVEHYQEKNELDLTPDLINSLDRSWQEGVNAEHSGDYPCIKCNTLMFQNKVDLILRVLSG